jgi:large subunit ribosomal protein L18e
MKTNPEIIELIKELKKASIENKVNVWKAIAEKLESPRRNWSEVNLSKLSRYIPENAVVVVPGKVLASGQLDKKLTIAAFSFSEQAKKKIAKAKGEILSIRELISKNPKGSNIKIIG